MSWRVPILLVVALATGCDREGAHPPEPADTAEAEEQGDGAEPGDSAAGDPAGDGRTASSATATAAAPAPPPPPTPAMAGECPKADANHLGLLVTPRTPVAGEPLTVIAATFEGEGALAVRLEQGDAPIEADVTHRTGVPAAALVHWKNPAAGTATVVVGRDGTGLGCVSIKVGKKGGGSRPRGTNGDGVWPVKRKWTGAEEALFSAWIREMFHAPREDDLAWKALHEVTSDPSRNFLHGHYGWNEDNEDTSVGLWLRPDCADAPYFLRAYYSWKRELPHGFRQCSRGGRGNAPRCGRLNGVVGPPQAPPDSRKPGEVGAVQKYFRRTLAWGVHSGNGRAAFDADSSDFYPLALTRKSLRPGAIYADPYGHLFVLVELMPAEGNTPGILYAIDGQPDGSITRKRFWEGNFLWNPDPALGGSGFKGHRPLDVVKTGDGRSLAAASNAAIAKRPGYGDISEEQAKLSPHEFYDKMDALITPGKRDPFVAQQEAVQALFEAAKVRVTSVQNGVDFHKKSGGTVNMPSGHAIFETTGAWENYSTPARDLRMLIAIDLVRGFDDKVARNADVFLAEGQSMEELRKKLAAHRKKLLEDPALSFTYERSDGSEWKLSVAEVIERAEALEMAYNPNDCPEIRWGAPEKSRERSTCRRRAPAEQQRKMAAYRPWFAERRRPARGDPGPPVR